MDPLIGTELDGRYRLLEAIGEGAMGRVYRAERMDGTGQVAVKVLNEDCTREPDLRERFEREARARGNASARSRTKPSARVAATITRAVAARPSEVG